jgi:hypothetical protein
MPPRIGSCTLAKPSEGKLAVVEGVGSIQHATGCCRVTR